MAAILDRPWSNPHDLACAFEYFGQRSECAFLYLEVMTPPVESSSSAGVTDLSVLSMQAERILQAHPHPVLQLQIFDQRIDRMDRDFENGLPETQSLEHTKEVSWS